MNDLYNYLISKCLTDKETESIINAYVKTNRYFICSKIFIHNKLLYTIDLYNEEKLLKNKMALKKKHLFLTPYLISPNDYLIQIFQHYINNQYFFCQILRTSPLLTTYSLVRFENEKLSYREVPKQYKQLLVFKKFQEYVESICLLEEMNE